MKRRLLIHLVFPLCATAFNGTVAAMDLLIPEGAIGSFRFTPELIVGKTMVSSSNGFSYTFHSNHTLSCSNPAPGTGCTGWEINVLDGTLKIKLKGRGTYGEDVEYWIQWTPIAKTGSTLQASESLKNRSWATRVTLTVQ